MTEPVERAEQRRFVRLISAIALGSTVVPLTLLLKTRAANGFHGFPLDDPWIHLTYARNLLEHGAFAYFPGDPASAGSTAPLYTLLLTPVLAVTGDPKLASFALGLLCHAFFLFGLARWAIQRIGANLWSLVAVLIVALDGRLALLAVSGMETALFLALVTCVFYARAARRPALLAIALGAALWVRPDALILAGVLVVDAILQALGSARGEGSTVASGPPRALPWSYPAIAALALLMAGYFLFNWLSGGSLFPNTLAAKRAYYSSIPLSAFLQRDVVPLFLSHGWAVLIVPACLAIAAAVWQLARRRAMPSAAEIGWIVALPLAYAVMLPYSHRFQRYLVPLLPALGLLGVMLLKQGVEAVSARGNKQLSWGVKLVAATVLAAAVLLQLRGMERSARDHAFFCAYHVARHERTGHWLRRNTPAQAVIATHDVGAIAYLSRRRVVDTVGLIQPEAIPFLHSPRYVEFLRQLFQRENVSHLAVLRDWLEVDNVAPLFVAHPRPEVLEVFAWRPERVVLVPPLATQARLGAIAALRRGETDRAQAQIQRALRLAPRSARGWLTAGLIAEQSGRHREAMRAYEHVLTLAPGAREARRRLNLMQRHRFVGESRAGSD